MSDDEDQAAAVDVPLDDQDEPLADAEPVQLIETADDPSAAPPERHGEWVDADPGDPGLDHTGCAAKYLGGDGDEDQGDGGAA